MSLLLVGINHMSVLNMSSWGGRNPLELFNLHNGWYCSSQKKKKWYCPTTTFLNWGIVWMQLSQPNWQFFERGPTTTPTTTKITRLVRFRFTARRRLASSASPHHRARRLTNWRVHRILQLLYGSIRRELNEAAAQPSETILQDPIAVLILVPAAAAPTRRLTLPSADGHASFRWIELFLVTSLPVYLMELPTLAGVRFLVLVCSSIQI